jgi:hypothetical protein
LRTGSLFGERIVERHAFLTFGDGEAGEFFEQGDIGDEAVVDDLLREIHEVGLWAEGIAETPALIGAEQVLVEGEAGEPADFRFHRDTWRNECARGAGCQARSRWNFLAKENRAGAFRAGGV